MSRNDGYLELPPITSVDDAARPTPHADETPPTYGRPTAAVMNDGKIYGNPTMQAGTNSNEEYKRQRTRLAEQQRRIAAQQLEIQQMREQIARQARLDALASAGAGAGAGAGADGVGAGAGGTRAAADGPDYHRLPDAAAGPAPRNGGDSCLYGLFASTGDCSQGSSKCTGDFSEADENGDGLAALCFSSTSTSEVLGD